MERKKLKEKDIEDVKGSIEWDSEWELRVNLESKKGRDFLKVSSKNYLKVYENGDDFRSYFNENF